MRKFAKLSLVTALAVSSFSMANAKDLSEAIKGVDISGTVVYRYNDYNVKDENNAGKEENKNFYKVVANLKVPVNDNVTLNTSLAINNDFEGRDNTNQGDINYDLQLTKVNFTYTGISNTSITLGKQGIATPFTNPSDSDAKESTGTGLYALSTFDAITLGAAYFNQTNLTNDGTNLAALGVLANLGGVSFDAWYADHDESLEAWTIGAKYGFKIDEIKVSLEARHSNLEKDADNFDNELTILGAKVKAGIFDAKVRYGMGGNDGSEVAFTKYGKAAMVGWNTELGDSTRADADYLQTSLGVKVTDTIHLSANYNEVDSDIVSDREEELFAQLVWKPSKNLKTYIRLGEYEEDDGEKSEVGRLQIAYKF